MFTVQGSGADIWYQADAFSKKIYTDPEKTTNDESLGHAINTMHALGMKVMLKPHVDLADGRYGLT